MRAAIELFGSKWCEPCSQAKSIIEATNPQKKGVTFTYVDVTEQPGYALKTLPVIFVGDAILEGPTETKLRAALGVLYASLPAPTDAVKPADESQTRRRNVETPSDVPWFVLGVFLVFGFVAAQQFSLD